MNPEPSSATLALIGWREWLALPDLGIPAIKAKTDTGARTSSLHTHDYQIERRGEEEWVTFHLHPLPRRAELVITCEAKVQGYRWVKNSGGKVERRPFLRTRVVWGECAWEMDLNLANREEMKFRMLLGREALAGGWLMVDPSRSYLAGTSLKNYYGRKPRVQPGL